MEPINSEGDVAHPRGDGAGGGAFRTVVAWVALACVAGLMIWLNSAPASAGASAGPGAPAAPLVEPEHDAGVMLRVVGKYALGVRELGKSSPILKDPAVTGRLVGTMADQAHTQTAKLRVAMLTAELEGPDAARDQLDALLADEALDAGLRTDAELTRRTLPMAISSESEASASSLEAATALTPDEQARLRSRHNWFAEVLFARGLPDTDPARASIIRGGERTVFAFIAAFGVGLVAIGVGFVIAVIGAIMLASGSLRPAYKPHALLAGTTGVHRAALLESLVLFVVALLGLGAAAEAIEAAGGPDLKLWLLWLALAAAWWPRLWGMDRAAWKTALGWHTGTGLFREIGAGVIGYLGGLPIVLLGLVTTFVLLLVTDATPSHPAVERMGAQGGGWWEPFQLMVLACVWAPVCEETFFRGAMYAHCRRWMHAVLSAVLVAFVFAAIHPQGWAVVPALMGLAVSFALIREWRGSIIASITAHAIQNGFVMTLNLLILR